MVSLRGETFAGRVGASILEAATLSRLVAASPEEYFRIAVNAFEQPAELQACRQVVADGQARRNLAVFDMTGFTRNLEGLYRQMWQNHLDGRHQPIFANSPACSVH